jgi:thiol-disulfide isomerase/thioredoxin
VGTAKTAALRQALLAVGLIGLSGLLAAAAGDKPAPVVGRVAPDFKSKDAVTHAPIHLSEQQGKIVVLTFWATWCAPCRKELPILENLQRKLGNDRLVVYAVPFEEPEHTYAALVKAARSWQIALVDDRYESIAREYGIKAIPHLFLIGRDGRIAAEHTGFGAGSVEQLVDDVNAAFRAAPPESSTAASPPAPTD